MKQMIALMLCLALMLSATACGGGNNGGNDNNNTQSGVQNGAQDAVQEDEQSQQDSGDQEEQDGDAQDAPDTPDTPEDSGEPEEEAPDADDGEPETPAEDTAPEKDPVRASHSDVTLKAAGNSFTLKVEGMEGVYAATYTSADPAIATVDENGLVTAVAPGTTTVSVQVEGNGTTYDFSCIVRCNWKDAGAAEGEGAGSAESDDSASGSVDLTAFYNDMISQYEFQSLQAFTGEVLESYYPGMSAIATNQCLIMGTMMSMNNGEFCLVEVSDSKDVDTVKSIFQTRIDNMAGGGAWYPGPTEIWTNSSRVVSNGNYVMMVVNPSCDDIVDAFNALFA